ncbi:hypothetical protein BGW80DRAFT_52257 [Lactifluus volemus]|nr:hypothetical protein BGW80DRAFT_52257 [Lactifluus volemus]
MLFALLLRTTLLPSYPRNFIPHALTHFIPHFYPKSTIISFSLYHRPLSCLIFFSFFLALSHPYSCRNPSILRKRCTLAGRFLLAVRYSCLSTPFSRRRDIVSRHYVFLGSPTAFVAGASKSKTRFDRHACVYCSGRVTRLIDSNCSCNPSATSCKLWNFGYNVHVHA